MSASKRKENGAIKPLDGGWGWVIVVAGIVALFQWGIVIRSFGVFHIEMSDRYQATASEVSWVGAISMTLGGMFGPLSGALIKRFSHRSVTIAGGLLGCLSMVLTAFAPTVEITYLTYGILGGFAGALTYTPSFTIVGAYFQKRRASAMGLLSCGTAVASFAAPPAIRFIYEELNYSAATMVIGAFLLNTCVGGALYRPLVNNRRRTEKEIVETELKVMNIEKETKELIEANYIEKNDITENDNQENIKNTENLKTSNEKYLTASANDDDKGSQDTLDREKLLTEDVTTVTNGKEVKQDGDIDDDKQKNKTFCSSAWSSFKKYFDPSLLLDINLVAMNITELSMLLVLSMTSAFLPALARDLGFTKMQGAFLLSLSGMGSLLAMPAGFCFDIPRIKRHLMYIYFFFCILTAILSLITPLFKGFEMLCAISFIRGAATNIVQSQRATISATLVGVDRLENAFGYILLFAALGSFLGRSTTGVLRDTFGSYDVAFYLSGAILVLASLFLLFTAVRKQRIDNRLKKEEQVDNIA